MAEGVFIWLLVFIIALFLWFGVRAYTKVNMVRFFYLGDGLTLRKFVSTLVVTNLSLGNYIILCAIWGYFFGISGAIWVSIAIVLLVGVFYCVAPKFRDYIEDTENSGTLHEYLATRFVGAKGNPYAWRLRLTASLATVLCLSFALVLELVLAASLLAAILQRPDLAPIWFIILTACITAYASLGGYRAVVITDVIQAVCLMVGVLGFGAIALMLYPPQVPYSTVFGLDAYSILLGIGWANALSISVIGAGWFLVTMDTWQRACASRSLRVSKTGSLISGFLLILAVWVYSYIGIYARTAIEPIVTGSAAVEILSKGLNPVADIVLLPGVHSAWGGVPLALFFVGLIAAALSTADTFSIVCSHSIVSDLIIGLGQNRRFGDLTENQQRTFAFLGRAVTVGMGLIVLILWWLLSVLDLLRDPLTLFFLAYSIQFALLVPIVRSLGSSMGNAMAATFSVLVGIVVSLGIGLWAALNLQSGTVGTVIGMSFDQWLALSPVLAILAGAVVYMVLAVLAKFLESGAPVAEQEK